MPPACCPWPRNRLKFGLSLSPRHGRGLLRRADFPISASRLTSVGKTPAGAPAMPATSRARTPGIKHDPEPAGHLGDAQGGNQISSARRWGVPTGQRWRADWRQCARVSNKAACGWQRGEPRFWLTGREAGRYSGTILNRPQQALSFLGEPLTAVPTGPDRPAASCSAPPLGPAQDS